MDSLRTGGPSGGRRREHHARPAACAIVKIGMSKPHRRESTSEEWRLRALRRIVALFAALLVSLTLTAAASANVSFTRAWGWGVTDGARRFETCTSTCRAGIDGGGAGQLTAPTASPPIARATSTSPITTTTGSTSSPPPARSSRPTAGALATAPAGLRPAPAPASAGIAGGGAGQLDDPWGVATDSSGDVYVADYDNERIDEFSAAGAFIKAYGWGVSDGASQFETCTSTCQRGFGGGGAGQLYGPEGVATDRSGDVYVADSDNERIDEFSAAGVFIKAYGWGVSDGASQFETCTSTCQPRDRRAAAPGSSTAP